MQLDHLASRRLKLTSCEQDERKSGVAISKIARGPERIAKLEFGQRRKV